MFTKKTIFTESCDFTHFPEGGRRQTEFYIAIWLTSDYRLKTSQI